MAYNIEPKVLMPKELRAFVKDLNDLAKMKKPRDNHYWRLRGILLGMGMSGRAVSKLVLPMKITHEEAN